MLDSVDMLLFKEQFIGHKVIYIIISNKEFVFRTLTKKEYKNILEICSNEHELENSICQVGLLYPGDYDFKSCPLAGVPKTVAPIIVELSGFVNPETVVQEYQKQKDIMATSFENQCQALVKAAFSEITFEEMYDWTWERLLSTAAKAEFILNIVHDSDIELVNKMDEQKKKVEDNNINHAQIVKELRRNGHDPMKVFHNEIFEKKEYVDFPLIGGLHWKNEEILDEIRRQMEKRSKA